MEPNAVTEAKVLDPGTKAFTANGNQYRIHSTMPFERWRDLQKLQVELSFGTEMADMVKGLQEAYSHLNKQEFADSAVCIKNLLLGVHNISMERIPTALRICCLFINKEGEDVRTIDEATIQAKVNDWQAEGLDMVSFFRLALGCIPGFMTAYGSLSPSSSQSQQPESPDPVNTTNTGSN